ncbi:phage tail length tape measure protein [Escherichia coli]|nr:phage tail length tape measure protein [Escherichia coli]
MAAMLTGSEQNWRSFTRSVMSMMTEILLKQARVGIVGRIGCPIGGAVGGGGAAGGRPTDGRPRGGSYVVSGC